MQDLQPNQVRLRGVRGILQKGWKWRVRDREPKSIHLCECEALPECAEEERAQVGIHGD